MNIAGIQPLSLIDYPGRPCSIIFTQGCIFRCSYCHNPDLIPLEAQESARAVPDVLSFLEERKDVVDAVCITGGEPTIQQGIIEFIATLKNLGISVKLDTNGIRPDIVEQLISARLVDYVAMDLKATWAKYRDVVRAGTDATVEACKRTFELIQDSDIDHEFRTTVMPGVHRAEDFIEMAGYLKNGERYFFQKTSRTKTLESLPVSDSIDIMVVVGDLSRIFPSLSLAVR
ncbi:MAG: anaerobic ribonucleoside-triphosphate reductase activating protein [Patescibacteria group bacterium]